MINITPQMLDIDEENMESYQNICFEFYKNCLYSKASFDSFLNKFLSLQTKHKNDEFGFTKLSFDLSDYLYNKCITSQLTANIPMLVKLTQNLLNMYKYNKNAFNNFYMCGKRNFFYYINLFELISKNTNKQEIDKLKNEMQNVEKSMQEFRNSILTQNK